MFRISTIALLATVALLGLSSALRAQDKRRLATPEELRRFEFEVEMRTLRFMKDFVNPTTEAKRLRLVPPVWPPSLGKEDVEELVRSEVEKLVDQHFPSSDKARIEEYVTAKFPKYEIGQRITVVHRNRLNQWEPITGTLRKVSANGIQLGDRQIVRADLHHQELPHFFLEERMTAMGQLQEQLERRYSERKAEWMRTRGAKVAHEVWRRYGYGKLRRGGWIPRFEWFEKQYQQQWDKVYEEVRAEVRETVLRENGYVKDPVTLEWFHDPAKAQAVAAADASQENADPMRGGLLWELRDFFKKVRREELDIEAEDVSDDVPLEAPTVEDLWGN